MTAMFALALHGGAGAVRYLDYARHRSHMRKLATETRALLSSGGAALDVVSFVVEAMESSGLYVAGRGASPGLQGDYELDACIMDGRSRRAGAVAALQGFQSPIKVARAVMERTPHSLVVGDGAARFAREVQAQEITDARWFTHAAEGESNFSPTASQISTVGCVALDQHGDLAAATSSAGVFGKMQGRVGDSPLPGCGTWADQRVAVSCTGQGELFMQSAAAAQVRFRMEYERNLETSVRQSLGDALGSNGEGGVIAVDCTGKIAVTYRAEGMKRAIITPGGEIHVAVFDEALPAL